MNRPNSLPHQQPPGPDGGFFSTAGSIVSHPLIVLVPCLLIVLALAPPARCETRYVIDQLIINLRSGPSDEYRIIDTLKTGTPLEILEKGDPYVKVKTRDGREGYVLAQYLNTEPPAVLVAARLREEVDRLTALQTELTTQRDELQTENAALKQSLEQELERMGRVNTAVEQELEADSQQLLELTQRYEELMAIAGEAPEIAAERDHLKAEQERLRSEIQRLEQEKESQTRHEALLWFLAGAGVLLIGWLIGKRSRRKRPSLL